MPAGEPDELFEKMRARVREGGGSRSKLSVWMAERQQQIAALIAECGADWDGWAEDFIAAGLMERPAGWGEEGPDGARARRRAAETARMAWTRLQKRRPAARPKKAASLRTEPELQGKGSDGSEGKDRLQRFRNRTPG